MGLEVYVFALGWGAEGAEEEEVIAAGLDVAGACACLVGTGLSNTGVLSAASFAAKSSLYTTHTYHHQLESAKK